MRKSNFELLRIISMLMIVTLHYILHMMPEFGILETTSKNYYIVAFIESTCIIAVNVFILITGYFSINTTKVNLSKIVKIIFNTMFYGVLLYIVIGGTFQIKELVKSILSVLFYEGYWFVKVYVGLFFLVPFINKAFKNMSESMYKQLLILTFILFSVWSTVGIGALNSVYGTNIIQFILLYSFGGYLRLHFKSNKKGIWLCGYFISTIITFICIITPQISNVTVLGYAFIFNILGAICLFIYFSKLNIQSNFINKISTTVFGIYLIHNNPYLSQKIYSHSNSFWNSNLFIINLILTVIIIFVVCAILEYIKERLFKNTIYKLIDNIFDYEIGDIKKEKSIE